MADQTEVQPTETPAAEAPVFIPKERFDEAVGRERAKSQALESELESLRENEWTQYGHALGELGVTQDDMDSFIQAKAFGTAAQSAAATAEMKDAGVPAEVLKRLEEQAREQKALKAELSALKQERVEATYDSMIDRFEQAHKSDCPRGSDMWGLVSAVADSEERRTGKVPDLESCFSRVKAAMGETVTKATETMTKESRRPSAAPAATRGAGKVEDERVSPTLPKNELARKIAEQWEREHP